MTQAPKMRRVTIWVDGSWVKLRAPWHPQLTPAFNQDLKDRIPYSLRKWEPTEKVWMVDAGHDAELMDVLHRWFEDVAVLEPPGAPAPPPPVILPADDPYAKMLRLCPDRALAKVFRVIAAELHPDKEGGDTEKMVQLNALWAQIRQERGL